MLQRLQSLLFAPKYWLYNGPILEYCRSIMILAVFENNKS